MEEDGYNKMDIDEDVKSLEEDTKYKIKLDAPKSEPAFDDSGDEGLDAFDDAPADDSDGFGGFGDEEGGDKPFDDEPFDADVEANEDEDPEKYIQQLSGKLGTSLRKYGDERGEPDFDLEKYAINSVVSATHTSEMDEEDQNEIIRKIKTSGADEEGGEDLEEPAEDALGDEEPADDAGFGDEEGFGAEGGLEEEEGPAVCKAPIDIEGVEALKRIAELQESEKKSTFVEKTNMKDTIKGKLNEMTEPAIKPAPVKTPTTPTKKPRRERIFQPNPGVKTTPAKMKGDGSDIK